jgi:hypothetical protein
LCYSVDVNNVTMSEGNREQNIHEGIERKRAECLFFDYAKTHIDQILTSDDWLIADLPTPCHRPLPEKGSWVIYCKIGENETRRVGITMFDDNGKVFDVIEFETDDKSIPLSPEKSIAPKKIEIPKNPEITRENEVCPGKYQLTVRYKKRGGVEVTEKIHEISVYPKTTEVELLENARSWISMIGLHNYGLVTGEEKTQRVYFMLTNESDEAINYKSSCLVDQGGHIVKE